MEPKISVNILQDLDKESGQVNADCLGVPLVLREVLQHFSTTELIQLSLVNKLWNYEARSLMRNRGNLSANITKNQRCHDIRAFASDMRRMKEITKMVPFSGLKVSLGWLNCQNKLYCQQSPSTELDIICENIVGGLSWKNLSIRMIYGWEKHKNCAGFILMKKVLEYFATTLEDVSVEIHEDAVVYFTKEFFQGHSFPSLKTFRLENKSETLNPVYTNLMKTVVSQAPNLQEVHTAWKVDLFANFLEGSSAVHVAGYPYFPTTYELPESVVNKLRQPRLCLSAFHLPFSLERFNRINTTLLQASRTIISTVDVDVIFLVPLMAYGICLENVRTFYLGFSFDPPKLEKRRPEIWELARRFDFTRLFPNLDTVTVFCNVYRNECMPGDFNEMIEQVTTMLKAPTPDRAVNIKHLRLEDTPHGVFRWRLSFPFLAQMFPNVEKLSFEVKEMPSTDILDIWVQLKEVDVTIKCTVDTLTNLDSVFCGIFPEEVAQLREQTEEYLRRVNIVPVLPTIAYLKELRTFKVCYDENWSSYQGPTDDPTCVFSKVTALIAFQRLPHLTVILSTEDKRLAEAVGHLRPYASVVLRERAPSYRRA